MPDKRLTRREVMSATRDELVEFATRWSFPAVECGVADDYSLEDWRHEFLVMMPIHDERSADAAYYRKDEPDEA